MKICTNPIRVSFQSILTALVLLTSINGTCANQPPSTTAFSETSPDYKRVRLPSGKFRPETYIVGEGIKMDKSKEDESLSLSFSGVAHILSDALYEADYIPSSNPEETDLLIVISWGKTQAFDRGIDGGPLMGSSGGSIVSGGNGGFQSYDFSEGDLALNNSLQKYGESSFDLRMATQEMFDRIRSEANIYNAGLLGYGHDLVRSQVLGNTVLSMRWLRNDLIAELESSRYFVILQAYDFQKIWKEKERKLLWTTRFSIRAKGRRFDEDLWSMAMASSRVIGRNTERLNRNLKQARVEFGELEYLGVEKEAQQNAAEK